MESNPLCSEFDRLLARCPRLRSHPGAIFLLEKGHAAMLEEEVVDFLAGVSLHPDYTFPILSCFRRVARKVVNRTVALLGTVPNLGKSSEEYDGSVSMEVEEEEEEEEGVNLIESYSKKGRGLELHELASFAFSRALDLLPFLKGCVEHYFEIAPPPFARILKTTTFLNSFEASNDLLHIVRMSYRLLHGNMEHFPSRWDWSWILDVLKRCESIHMDDNPECMKNILDTKWCGIQMLAVLLKLPNRTGFSFGLTADEAMACFLRWHEFCWDVSVEKAGWFLLEEDNVHLNKECVNEKGSAAVSSVHLVEMEQSQINGRLVKCHFVTTSVLRTVFQSVFLAVNQKWPVLLHGYPGCGKTALINKLAHDSGRRVLSIHMDEHIDGRTLIGSYVCTEQPGEFRWQPGSLTQAVANGLWVVFENIDLAPSDVHSILLPLLEGRSSFATVHGEEVKVADSFRLFSTISTHNLDTAQRFEGSRTLSSLWRRIMIAPPSTEDIKSIIAATHPDLEPIVQNIIDIFSAVTKSSGCSSTSSSLYRFGLRDILKFCKRIASTGFSFKSNSWSPLNCNMVYLEAVDIFGSGSSSGAIRTAIMEAVVQMCDAPISPVAAFTSVTKPIFQDSSSGLQIGRVTLQSAEGDSQMEKKPFVQLRSSLNLLERIACSVQYNEPVLLVGETGTGKTMLVQYLAARLHKDLTVLNLSQQSDVSDLLGGIKPVDARSVCIPLYKEFSILLSESGLSEAQVCINYMVRLQQFVNGKNWKKLLNSLKKATVVLKDGKISCGAKRRKRLSMSSPSWEHFCLKIDEALRQITSSSGMLFSFVEGAFITALRKGKWILLDEVNLAPPETLQRITGVLDGENSSLCLAEKGDVDYLERHPNFRIFACMNPANDAGKRDLPYSLRSRFTEYFVNDVLDVEDLTVFVEQFVDDDVSQLSKCSHSKLVDRIVGFYRAAKGESERSLQDGANQKPQYSLRSLFRALEYTRTAMREFGFQRALYDGFAMFFMTLLDRQSAMKMDRMIVNHLLDGKAPQHTTFHQYLVNKVSPGNYSFPNNYVLTKSVKDHLKNLARAIKKYPVLLQGPTSSGKTSMVRYLAEITGNEFVRINNHEHTDLQEYLGSYITDCTGELVFHEGVLVKAVRSGQWIVLDELNLAPSDVLEALNRLLDDNRELFVPELQETVRAHPDFMLFATQNPPTFYGGRKMLSRAFRNRFVEIHVDEIPEEELCTILEKRCKVPESYAQKMVGVMKDLQLRRRSSKVFAGKHGFITPRDLFRWAERFHKSEKSSREDLALDGYLLLAERLRDEAEKLDVKEVLSNHLGVGVNLDNLYEQRLASLDQGMSELPQLANSGEIIWTKNMRRLYFLVRRCYEMREPVLLVGETGGGKTTVCQLLSAVVGSNLHILNCHQYTETSDFIGGFYPVRERSKLILDFKSLIKKLLLSKPLAYFPDALAISDDINQVRSTFEVLKKVADSYRLGLVKHVDKQDLDSFENMRVELSKLHQKWQTIFTWQDGPLVRAMKDGDLFLVDEISLADDSVLERLNSVLEPERKLALAEKGGPELEKLTAHPNFFLLATMNPGGDYGKKELSPALRNRFTEIWVPSVGDLEELHTIAQKKFSRLDLANILLGPLVNFWEWFNKLQTGRILTVRDLLSWVAFINVTERSLSPEYAFLHGAFLVVLDGLSLGTGIAEGEASNLRKRCLNFLVLELEKNGQLDPQFSAVENYGWSGTAANIFDCSDMESDNLFGIHPFFIERGVHGSDGGGFELLAPTTRKNALRTLRAMQLSKPVLLEGSPGVGKTSLIIALGKFSGHKVVRINLSEQTDLMDLLGSDLPIECETGIQFAWSDGILLQALKEGSWVLLDELNLAPQSVLEGLNAILDHRAEVFIPELGVTFKCPPSFRVFACQNPTYQGGGRKGLPKSFLNRFTKVYVDQLDEDDYHVICSSLFPEISRSTLAKVILFNKRLYEETMLYRKFAQDGSPWEFNLRDVIRSCHIIKDSPDKSQYDCFLSVAYIQRMRTEADRREVLRLHEEVFGSEPCINPYPRVELKDQYLVVGTTHVKRNVFHCAKTDSHELNILPEICFMLEAACQCVKQQWLCILVGPTSSGKTSLVRLLAQLTGNILLEINMSSATDISELLGCFEQYNAFRKYRSVVAQVRCYVMEYCNQLLVSLASSLALDMRDLMTTRLAFFSNVNLDQLEDSSSTDANHWESSLSLLGEIIGILRLDLEMNVTPTRWSLDDLGKTLQIVHELQGIQCGKSVPVKFEWAVGLLLRAIENGDWIVLKDANLCNPTVLDRINSLVESNGFITVNECGNIDGKPLTLRPHPNFRMFLTVNPMYGEVSRAMRNRGVEIFMMKPHWILGKDSSFVQETEMNDVKRFLTLSSIPNGVLVDLMAKAHLYARDEGLRLNVKISYLELERWVHLFQQLLMTGNQPLGSLHLSWENIYLSSFGESLGWDIVNHAKTSYLSLANVSSSQGSFILQGGWPVPLSSRDFICFSKEACVKRNCMYLEFLGSQYASYQRSIFENQLLKGHCITKRFESVYLVDKSFLQALVYPNVTQKAVIGQHSGGEFDKERASKMLLFAADWIIEQATESDIELYLLWLSWYNCHVQPYCQFFRFFLDVFRHEQRHPVWKCIYDIRHNVAASVTNTDFDLDIYLQSLPMLSPRISDLMATRDTAAGSSKSLMYNAVNCIPFLRRTLWQWNVEDKHDFDEGSKSFIPVLKSLRMLEEKFLREIVSSSHFQVHVQSYADLLEEHVLFWNCAMMSQSEYLLFHWRCLIKKSEKLEQFCPEAVQMLLAVSDRSPWPLRSFKPMLWIHGGHPFMPSTSEVYYQIKQLFALSEVVWPMKKWGSKHDDGCLIEFAASCNSELRFEAMQGLCISSCLVQECDEAKNLVIEELVKINKSLLTRYQHEKQKLKEYVDADKDVSVLAIGISCGILSPEMICTDYGLDCWFEICPVADKNSLLSDFLLLQKLSEIIVSETSDLKEAMSHLSGDLKSAMHISLSFSSRSPVDMLAHQKILWMLDAWESAGAVDMKLASSALDMWFRWHSFLWNNLSILRKDVPGKDVNKFIVPDLLFLPVMAQLVERSVESVLTLKEYFPHSMKLKVASCGLRESSTHRIDLYASFLCSACSLLQQIIYAHRKSFSANNFASIRSKFSSLLSEQHLSKETDMQTLISLLKTSTHRSFTSLIIRYLEPLLRELYLKCSPDGAQCCMTGTAWRRLGELRLHLLLNFNDVDPSAKYMSKFMQVREKFSSLELEMKVRQECNYLVGSHSSGEAEKQHLLSLRKLESERKRLQRKIVFRADSGQFKKLKNECDEFLTLVSTFELMDTDFQSSEMVQFINRANNWQETASCFIERLSNEYAGYADVIQPVQVAVYEMKLGVSLTLSSFLEKQFLDRAQDNSIDFIMNVVCSFMRFPREPVLQVAEADILLSQFPFCPNESYMFVWAKHSTILEKFVNDCVDVHLGKKVSPSLSMDTLGRVMDGVSKTQLLDNTAFLVLDDLFADFTSIWVRMKFDEEIKKGSENLAYKFKPRGFEIDDICEVDLSSLGDSSLSTSFTEWNGFLYDGDEAVRKDTDQESETLSMWNSIEESAVDSVVVAHNQLFGSSNLVVDPGVVIRSDEGRLISFAESYNLGANMIKELRGISASILDTKLVPQHLLRLFVDHEQKLRNLHKLAHVYNFYKDSNSSALVGLVKLLTALQKRVSCLLDEWEENPGLQKILDIVNMLLALPLSTPLAKVLSGLQFLFSRFQTLQEEGSKFPLKDELEPMHSLACSWQRLEIGSWGQMPDEVLGQFERNAAKLWFPLHSILHPKDSADTHNDSLVKSLGEFIETSNVGEFRRRLQLLLSFHGQVTAGICLGSYTSPFQIEISKVLYNLFGTHVQLLPIVMEHVASVRKKVDKKLEDLVKLRSWNDKLMTIEDSKRYRQKLKKIVQEYTEILQQPILLILQQKSAESAMKAQHLSPVTEIKQYMAGVPCDVSRISEAQRATWLTDWLMKVDDALKNLCIGRILELDCSKDAIQSFSASSFPGYQEVWGKVWNTLENVFVTAVDCASIWNEEGKKPLKKRALDRLLKLLEESGLAKHKSAFPVISESYEQSDRGWWLYLPSYEMKHLLVKQDVFSYRENEIAPSEGTKCELLQEWRVANQYYFKSLASVHKLSIMSVNFDQEQVGRSKSFLSQLVVIQQDQREAAYSFSKNVENLRDCILCLKNACTFLSSSDNVVVPNQQAMFWCMWKQKDLFDTLSALSEEEALLLRTVDSAHSSDSETIKSADSRLLALVETFIPIFKKSKALLDHHLLGNSGYSVKLTSAIRPLLVSKDMEDLLIQNFKVLREFEYRCTSFEVGKGSVEDVLVGYFLGVFKQRKEVEEEFLNQHVKCTSEEELTECEAGLCNFLRSTFGHVMDVIRGVQSRNSVLSSAAGWENITSWKSLFDSYDQALELNLLVEELLKIISNVGKLTSISDQSSCLLIRLHGLLDLLLAFGDGVLHDFLTMHKMVAVLTDTLAETFSSLFSKGYQTPTEDLEDETGGNMTKDASGTGMGEGSGVKDVSDQITDEDQLLGASKEKGEEDASEQLPSKTDKGIEMEDDFEADACSLSEDSTNDHDDVDEDGKQLDSELGKAGDDSERVDEKLWNKEEDETPENAEERNECGPSVRDKDYNSRELRAKEESALMTDNIEEGNPDQSNEVNDTSSPQDGADVSDGEDELSIERKDALPAEDGVDLDEPKTFEEETEMKDDPSGEQIEDGDVDKNENEMNLEEDEMNGPRDETAPEGNPDQVGEPENDQSNNSDEGNGMMDLTEPRNDLPGDENSGFHDDLHQNMEATMQPIQNMHAPNPSTTTPEVKWSSGIANQSDFSLSDGASQLEIMLENTKGQELAQQQPKSQAAEKDSLHENLPNPLRGIGDALKDWKERVKVSTDIQDDNRDTANDEMMDEDAVEYGFTSEFDKGTAQAQGPAMPDQVEQNLDGDKLDRDGPVTNREKAREMEAEKKDSESVPIRSHATLRSEVEELDKISSLEKSPEEGSTLAQDNLDDGDSGSLVENILSFQKSYMQEDTTRLFNNLSVNHNQPRKMDDYGEVSAEMKDDASVKWRKYELTTARLSQELAEQLRLVMEPTLASKLQGDYRTGKRINMKKVIPYIASHYRKDKIWLRRTRPNKRDYQVVIAVDDSRSMMESGCESVAIEALITVCRAMSHLEVGKLAVASFGKEGNIKLLHSFEQPFTAEAGIKMISSLTFKQENTIVDEPIVDLLTNLNGMLDQAVENSRRSSGRNPLEQLVLIIADGRFHEKEKLKRHVRELLNQRRMVAFLLLDSPQESIVNFQEASFEGGQMKFSNYLDSFPFPYYMILKNMDALPRSLADLLRQWFEVLNYSRD